MMTAMVKDWLWRQIWRNATMPEKYSHIYMYDGNGSSCPCFLVICRLKSPIQENVREHTTQVHFIAMSSS